MAQPVPDTDALLMLCKSGAVEAQNALFARHRGRLRRMIQTRLDPRLAQRLDASDVIQDVLAKAAKKLPSYLRDRDVAFYPWLRQIAFDRLVELHRAHVQARCRSVRLEWPYVASVPDDSVAELAIHLLGRENPPESLLIQEEIVARVRAAIDNLSSVDRELIILRHIEQLSIADVASILSMSEGAVRTRHFRVLRQLRAELSGETQ